MVSVLVLWLNIDITYFKVSPRKEADESDKAAGDKKEAVTINEKKEAPLATPEA